MAGRKRRLTDKQAAFVEHYLVDLNATKAAIKAGYSEKNAARIGYELLNNSLVKDAIENEKEARRERLRLTADDVLIQLMQTATLDIKQFLSWDENGRVVFRPSEEIDGRMVRKIKGTTKKFGVRTKKNNDGTATEFAESVEHDFEFELASQEKARDLLFKHFGLAAPIEVKDTAPLSQVVAAALGVAQSVKAGDENSDD